MIEAIKEAFDILNQITHGLGTSILAIIPISMGLNVIFKITRMMCMGERIIDIPSRTERNLKHFDRVVKRFGRALRTAEKGR